LFYTGKKNGKSETGAAVALYMLVGDEEEGAEIYSAASDREQAGIIYRVAQRMVENSAALSKRCKVIESQKRIVFYKTGSFYQVLSADVENKHGFNPHAVIFDELHTQPNRELWDVLTEGSMILRRQPLIFAMTTAGFDKNSICHEVYDYAKKVKKGIIEDNRFLPVLYETDENDDWEDEANWYKANPSLGTLEQVNAGTKLINIEDLRESYRQAKETPARINKFRRLHLNQWTSQEVRWMDICKWDESDGKVEPEELKGKICYAGLDLSSTTDIAAFVLVFPVDDIYKVIPLFFIPSDNIEARVKKDKVPYDTWLMQGYIIATPGNVIDYKFIEDTIYQYAKEYEIEEIAYDPWNATMLTQRLADNGLTMVDVRQGFASMSAPTKQLEALILQKRIHHGGNPVLRFMFDNVMVIQDANGNIKPDKAKSHEKIDGIVSLIMAISRAMVAENIPLGRGAILI
jgi:phage terminase large subunit-like protein